MTVNVRSTYKNYHLEEWRRVCIGLVGAKDEDESQEDIVNFMGGYDLDRGQREKKSSYCVVAVWCVLCRFLRSRFGVLSFSSFECVPK